MNIRYRVELSQAERDELKGLLSGGRQQACKLKRAQILLAADAGASDEEIARSVGVGGSTVYRTKRRFVIGNLEAASAKSRALQPTARSPAKRKPCWSQPLTQDVISRCGLPATAKSGNLRYP
jgi:IS30 family transposase